MVYVAVKASNAMNFTYSAGISSNGTMWRYDLARTGNYPNGPTALPLNLKWGYPTPDGSIGNIETIIANNVVYFSLAGNLYLYAVNATDGTLKWKYKGGGTFATPAIANGVVYAVCNDAKVYALDANTGVLKWSYATGDTVIYDFGSAVVADGIVYVTQEISTGTSIGRLYALDANTGALKWKYDAIAPILTSPTIANNTLYVVPESDRVYALDPVTGALKWYCSTGLSRVSTPCVSSGIVYVAGIKDLNMTTITAKVAACAINATTGTLLWTYATSAIGICGTSPTMTSSPAISGNTLYFGGIYTEVYALDITTQTLKWSFSNGAIAGTCNFTRSSPALSNNIIYVGSPNGYLYALDANTGVVKWSYVISTSADYPPNNPQIDSAAAVANGRVYIGKNNNLYCFGQ